MSATWTSGSWTPQAAATGRRLAAELADRMAIMGVFDEGCMGMYNAIIDDEYLNPMGLYKERLSQSALVAEMRLVTTGEATRGVRVADQPGGCSSASAVTAPPS